MNKTKYAIQKDPNGEPIACDSCGCEVPTVHINNENFCQFCYTTPAGNHARTSEVWRSTAVLANYLTQG